MTKDELVELIKQNFGTTIDEMKENGEIMLDTDEYDYLEGVIDLSELNFGKWTIYLSEMKAREIYNDMQSAETISNDYQEANLIYNDYQEAGYISNTEQVASVSISNSYQNSKGIIHSIEQKANKIKT